METKLHQLSGTCRELSEIVAKAQVSDKTAEERTSRWNFLGNIFFIGFLISGMILIGDLQNATVNTLGWFVVSGAFGFVAWKFFALETNAARFDVEDAKLDFSEKLLATLEVDTKENARLQLGLDLRASDSDVFKTEEKAAGSNENGTIRVLSHCQKWFVMRGRSIDGTVYRVCVNRLQKSKIKPKKGPDRIKRRVRERVVIHLRLRPSRYPELDLLAKALPDQVPAHLRMTSLDAKGHEVRAMFETDSVSSSEVVSKKMEVHRHPIASADNVLAALVYLHRGIKVLKGKAVKS
jgi:hypothetical protein